MMKALHKNTKPARAKPTTGEISARLVRPVYKPRGVLFCPLDNVARDRDRVGLFVCVALVVVWCRGVSSAYISI